MADAFLDLLTPFLWNASGDTAFERTPLHIRSSARFMAAHDLPELPLARPGSDMALVTEHADKPGEIERVVSILAGWGVNVAGAAVRRNRAGGRALLITLVDGPIADGAMKALRELELRPEQWDWSKLDDLDLTGFPLGAIRDGAAMVTKAPDQPGEIAKAARALAICGLNSTGFLVYREETRKHDPPPQITLQVNLLDKAPPPEIRSGEHSLLVDLCQCDPIDPCIVPLENVI